MEDRGEIAELFNGSQYEVFKMMETDTFRRFQNQHEDIEKLPALEEKHNDLNQKAKKAQRSFTDLIRGKNPSRDDFLEKAKKVWDEIQKAKKAEESYTHTEPMPIALPEVDVDAVVELADKNTEQRASQGVKERANNIFEKRRKQLAEEAAVQRSAPKVEELSEDDPQFQQQRSRAKRVDPQLQQQRPRSAGMEAVASSISDNRSSEAALKAKETNTTKKGQAVKESQNVKGPKL